MNEPEPQIREQAPVTQKVDEPELDYSTNEIGPHEGHSSAPVGDVQKPNDAIVSELAPRYVEKSEQVNSSTKTDPYEGYSSAPAGDVPFSNDAIVSESFPVSQYIDEVELDSADSDKENIPGAENSHKPNISTRLKRFVPS